VVGLLLHVLIGARDVFGLGSGLVVLQPAALHLVVVGFLTQIVFGVALWMFPRAAGDPKEPGPTGWWVFACLNIGLLLRVVAEPLGATSPGTGVAAALVLSALLQWSAAVGFVVMAWPRVRAR
jgi:hypothetical protein